MGALHGQGGGMTKPETIGVLGLGIIGSRVAQNLAKAGFGVAVWNRTRKEFPGFLPSPADVARAAQVVQVFVTDGPALLALIEAMGAELTPHHVVVNCSTISLEATQAAAARVAELGAAFLDAPFTGSRGAAEAGQLTYYVGGPQAVQERVQPVLAASAKTILPVGGVGQATVLKIATNMISATTVEILSEAMGVVTAHGVSLESFASAMDNNACSSGLTKMKIPSILAGDYTPHFSLKNMLKDARLAQDLAFQAGLEVPALSAAAQRMAALAGRGRGEEDYSVLAVNYVPAAGGPAA